MHTRCVSTCFFSATTSHRPKILLSSVTAHQQQLRQKAWHRQEIAFVTLADTYTEPSPVIECVAIEPPITHTAVSPEIEHLTPEPR